MISTHELTSLISYTLGGINYIVVSSGAEYEVHVKYMQEPGQMDIIHCIVDGKFMQGFQHVNKSAFVVPHSTTFTGWCNTNTDTTIRPVFQIPEVHEPDMGCLSSSSSSAAAATITAGVEIVIYPAESTGEMITFSSTASYVSAPIISTSTMDKKTQKGGHNLGSGQGSVVRSQLGKNPFVRLVIDKNQPPRARIFITPQTAFGLQVRGIDMSAYHDVRIQEREALERVEAANVKVNNTVVIANVSGTKRNLEVKDEDADVQDDNGKRQKNDAVPTFIDLT